jgi:hypothetical protein
LGLFFCLMDFILCGSLWSGRPSALSTWRKRQRVTWKLLQKHEQLRQHDDGDILKLMLKPVLPIGRFRSPNSLPGPTLRPHLHRSYQVSKIRPRVELSRVEATLVITLSPRRGTFQHWDDLMAVVIGTCRRMHKYGAKNRALDGRYCGRRIRRSGRSFRQRASGV